MKKLIQVLGVVLISGLVSYAVFHLSEEKQTVIIEKNVVSPSHLTKYSASSELGAMDFTLVAEKTVNAVVHVKTEMANTQEYYSFFHGKSQSPQVIRASGSGVIISSDGYIVTNNHVIDKAQNIEVALNDRQSFPAKVIGRDPTTDLALLKIEGSDLAFVNYGNSDDTKVGEWVLAVGNPFNLTSTVTAGIVSAKGRDINILSGNRRTGASTIESFIQTDAAVNPGNSGGALVNARGELVGINSAIQSTTGAFVGYSFAIPVNIVKKVVDDLKEFGTVQRAFIGVNIRNLDKKLAKSQNISGLNGVYVSGVLENGAASDAGIKEGDIITKVGAVQVNKVPELQEQISQFRPGDEVIITLVRDGSEIEKTMELKNYKGNTEVINPKSESILNYLGARLEPAKSEQLTKLNISGGVQVVELFSGKLMMEGVQEGYIITRIDKQTVREVDDVLRILDGKKGGVLIEGIYPNGRAKYYGFGM